MSLAEELANTWHINEMDKYSDVISVIESQCQFETPKCYGNRAVLSDFTYTFADGSSIRFHIENNKTDGKYERGCYKREGSYIEINGKLYYDTYKES